jgi:hypothetical protein
MKKRKPPVLLATFLIILVGVTAALNMPKGAQANDSDHAAANSQTTAQTPPPTGESRPQEDAGKVAERMKSLITAVPPGTKQPAAIAPEGGQGSKMAVPTNTTIERPKPDSNSVTSLRGYK